MQNLSQIISTGERETDFFKTMGSVVTTHILFYASVKPFYIQDEFFVNNIT